MESRLIFLPLNSRDGVTHFVVCMLPIREFNKQCDPTERWEAIQSKMPV